MSRVFSIILALHMKCLGMNVGQVGQDGQVEGACLEKWE